MLAEGLCGVAAPETIGLLLQPARLILHAIEEPARPNEFTGQDRQASGDRQPPRAGQGDHRNPRGEQKEAADDLADSEDAFHCPCRRWGLLHRSRASDKQRHLAARDGRYKFR